MAADGQGQGQTPTPGDPQPAFASSDNGLHQPWYKAWHQALRQRHRRRMLLARALRKGRELTPLADRTRLITPTSILGAMVMRNEIGRLPFWLAHHRALGVDHFLITDNDSDDGSRDYLLAQPDVSLWGSGSSYKKSRFGLDWMNRLLMRHGHGHWCLVLDADELLIYPYHETRPLPALTAWLDTQGQRAMPAMMLDLYPEGPLDAGSCPPGSDPRDCLPWFDSGNYMMQQQPATGSLWIQGGPRARCFFHADPRRAPSLNKIPLVKWHWRYAWLNSTHSLLPPRLNQVFDQNGGEALSGILLHTKFLPGIGARSAEEKARQQHFGDPARFDSYYDALTAAPVLKTAQSQRLTGWRQLEALGLMSRGGWI